MKKENGGFEQRQKSKKKSSTRKKVLIGLLVFLMVLLAVLGGAFIYLSSKLDKINMVDRDYDNSVYDSIEELPPEVENPNSEPDTPDSEIKDLESQIDANVGDDSQSDDSKPKDEPIKLKFSDDVLNVLLIGTDARTSDYRGRSDSMILVSINKETEEIVMTSIMRDVYLKIPGKGYNRINASYAYGGADLLIQTIEQNFKIRIDKFVQVDFQSFEKVVEAVGGVSIPINSSEITVMKQFGSDMNGKPFSGAGTYKLNGKQALAYSRIRKIGHSDFERTQRQRRVLDEIIKSAKNLSIGELSDSLDVILPLVTTDFKKGELIDLILGSVSYLSYDRVQLRIPADHTYSNMRIRGMAVLGIDFDENRRLMYETIYGD
ncbi:MAG: LCP family protein [Oscillospiraceae bacterium]|nr:LCP family protein [Oscillospiraceae bacterium]